MTRLNKFLTLAVLSTFATNTIAVSAQMSGGFGHGVIVDKGSVYAFGATDLGAVGPNGTSSMQMTPVSVGLDNVKMIASVVGWNVALKNDGSVWWWGWNSTTRVKNFTPTEIPAMAGATDVAVTKTRVVAVVAGKVMSYNFVGSPVEISGGLSNVVEIDAHENHIVMRTVDGLVFAVGENTAGQLGNGSTASDWLSPLPVIGPNGLPLTNVSKINAGLDFTVAVVNGTVFTWGKNQGGTFGTGDTTTPFTTSAIQSDITNVVDISANSMNVLATKVDGSLWGWGWHNFINGNTYNTSPTPTKLHNSVNSLGQGQYDAFYVEVNGVRGGWGSAINGKLGTGDQTELHTIGVMLSPTATQTTSDVSNVAVVPTGEILNCVPTEIETFFPIEVIREVEKIVIVEVVKEVVVTVYEYITTDVPEMIENTWNKCKKHVGDFFSPERPGYGYGDKNHEHTKQPKTNNVAVNTKK